MENGLPVIVAGLWKENYQEEAGNTLRIFSELLEAFTDIASLYPLESTDQGKRRGGGCWEGGAYKVETYFVLKNSTFVV